MHDLTSDIKITSSEIMHKYIRLTEFIRFLKTTQFKKGVFTQTQFILVVYSSMKSRC